ncbi:MAG TPA: methyltransferase domain-containing protein [Actinospica sp.]|jgi:SAM-dependent methyltransferase|nr:methyltransferase domain-containing protein [Actinospica sp.]
MSEAPTSEQLAEREAHYDAFHESGDVKGIVKTLRAQAWGDEYPEQVDPSSSCTWSVLGEMVGRLRLRPGALLVDLGCGRGGTGLWLARAFDARLIGLDVSPRALELARRNVAEFLPAERAEFRQATFERTGLPDGCADGVVSMDALPFAFDRDAAVAELRRILRPGARAVFTGVHRLPEHPEYDAAVPRWPERIRRAGLELEAEIVRPEEPGLWERLYAGLIEHEAQVRAELDERGAEILYDEVHAAGSTVGLREAVLYVARAPQ